MAITLPNFSNIFAKAKTALQKRDGESVVGIDVGTSSIKIVQLAERKGAAVLETYGEIALGPYGDAEVGQSVQPTAEKLTEALVDLMREANVTARTGGISVPLSGSLINVITLPSKNPDDLAAMVPIEARKYIPVPVSEVALDWFVIPDEESAFLSPGKERNANATDVLLVAIHNAVLTRLQSAMTGAGVVPKFYEIEPFSMGRAAYEHGTAPVMVIDLGASGTRVYVIEFGIIAVSHAIGRGAQDVTRSLATSKGMTFEEAEAAKRLKGIEGSDAGLATLDYIFAEARRIFLAYQRKEGKAISRVVLVGGGASLKGVIPLVTKNLDAPVSVAAPFDRVSAPAFIADVLTDAGATFATSVGLALRALKG